VFRLDEGLKVYLHRAPVDFRLSINGLAALVQQALGMDPFAACVYVFSNPGMAGRRCDRQALRHRRAGGKGPDGDDQVGVTPW